MSEPTSTLVRRTLCLALVLYGMTAALAPEALAEMKRYFYSGNGTLHLENEKNGKAFKGRYRNADQSYREDAYQAMSAVWGVPYHPGQRVLSLRLIEFLDFLEDRLRPGAKLIITSGYRAPTYNTRLRKGGAMAAKASLHQYGMAADFIMQGVPSERIWHQVRGLGVGGTGYYHGRTVHVDVGPARFWDEKSSGVGTGLSDDNKLIGLVTDYDRYAPGEWISMQFIRMTAFPINVSVAFSMIPRDGATATQPPLVFTPNVRQGKRAGPCMAFANISEMAALRWRLPVDISPGRYRVRAVFCETEWKEMPPEVETPVFEVRQR